MIQRELITYKSIMIPKERMLIEKKILDEYFAKRYVFVNLGKKNPYVDLGLRSNTGNVYRVKIMLKDFPYSMPQVFIVYPKKLKNYHGVPLSGLGVSGSMHLLEPSKKGDVQLCHYVKNDWTPNNTLYLVALKALVWINAYEGHLSTGNPIDFYLSHTDL